MYSNETVTHYTTLMIKRLRHGLFTTPAQQNDLRLMMKREYGIMNTTF